MHPDLRAYYDHVYPLFWPWLWWNMMRAVLWHQRTGRDALMAIDCFGNIRFVFVSDAPEPADLYTYEAPAVPRWECPALAGWTPLSLGRGVGVRGDGVAARDALADTSLPLIPNPFSPGRRGLSCAASVRGPP